VGYGPPCVQPTVARPCHAWRSKCRSGQGARQACSNRTARRVGEGGPLKGPDEFAALRERISALNAAILRIGASLDLDTVVREAAASARALTGARYGLIATFDESGAIEEFIASGVSPEERRHFEEWPHGHQLFEHLREQPGVLRLADLPAYIRSLGHSEQFTLSKTLLATPLRHGGVPVGHFFLGEKTNGEEFTDEDEEVLVLLAGQATTGIANARAHRDEQRARAGLEALFETSPVGVTLIDAGTGRPVSCNREARRIIGGLKNPDASLDQLLEVITFRRSDGREIRFDEFRNAERVRAEEIEISLPDGRSTTTLLNATPIRSSDGALESVVVTMQDLAPLEDLERLRAEFLGVVGHELRVPLSSIKGSATTALGTDPELDPTEMREFLRIIDEQADHMRGLIGDLLDVGRIDAGTLSVSPEPVEVSALVERARNTFLSGSGRHSVLVDLPPDLPRAMADRLRIVQVLNNLLSNAARHAPESTPIRISAVREGVDVAISVVDEGRGVAPERLPHLFRKHCGFGGAERNAALGGAGVGLAICKGLVEAHGGRIRAASGGVGQGTEITLTLPAAEAAGEDSATGTVPAPVPASREEPEQTPILVLDDDPKTLSHVREALAGSEFQPLVTGDPVELPGLIRSEGPRLVLLDLMLPGTDGIELMATVPELADLPVIFISGYGRDETIARALEAGAVDYIVKPFSAMELTARVRAALRRQADSAPFRLGNLEVNYEERRVSVAGRPVQLTATEYELLRVLSRHAGRVVSYGTLRRQVWGGRTSGNPVLVRTYIKKVRRKLGDPAYIVSERGLGYRTARPDDA